MMPDLLVVDVQAKMNEVKSCFIQRQYRHCANLCLTLLETKAVPSQPLQTVFLNLYAAVSYDFLARSMHYLSDSRLETFELAEKHYEAADSALRFTELDLPTLSYPVSGIHGGACSRRANDRSNGCHANEEMPMLTKVASPAYTETSDRDLDGCSSKYSENSRDFSFFLKSLVFNRFSDNIEELKVMIRGFLLEIPILKAQGQDASQSFMRNQREDDERTLSVKSSTSRLKQKPSYDFIGSANVRGVAKEEPVRQRRMTERPRRRFDSQRYQELCEKALAELLTSDF